jgi:ATP-dependent RNA helicase DHR2
LTYPISQSSAWQRTGRAGREGPGICFRLYTDEAMKTLSMLPIPEIKRIHLSAMLLHLKAYGVDDIFDFPFLDPPSRDAGTLFVNVSDSWFT